MSEPVQTTELAPAMLTDPRDPRGARAAASRLLRQWWWWGHLRRVQDEGFARALARRRVWDGILATAPVPLARGEREAAYDIHVVCCLADYISAIWALKSYLWQVGPECHLCIHLQGHATERMMARLRHHFPNARVIAQAEADALVLPELRRRGLARLERLRGLQPVMLKLVDVALLSTAGRLLVLDSDVLFFRCPEALRAAAIDRARAATFQRDVWNCYAIAPAQAHHDLGLDLMDRINTGMVAIDRTVIDLDLCERIAAHPAFQGESGWSEQTMYALLGSATGEARLLPPDYAISMEAEPLPAGLVARHYSGPSRRYLTEHGMPWLREQGWERGVNGTPD